MKILSNEIIAESQKVRIVKMRIYSEEIAQKSKPGQFVMLMPEEKAERIPLTIVESDPNSKVITIIFQVVGYTTGLLAQKKPGEFLFSLVGPLGHPTEIKLYGKVVLVAGGVGIAEILPIASALKEAGNYIITIIGVRTKGLLILKKELKEVSHNLVVMTEDGSYGRKGLVTQPLEEVLREEKKDLVYAVGPIPMMREVSYLASSFKVAVLVSLNALMVDGTGMCGCCRVSVSGQVKFSCVDGPEFDGTKVNWDELLKRNNVYQDKESHICQLKNIETKKDV